MAAKKGNNVQGDVVPDNVTILHDAMGPAHNMFTKGQVVPAAALGHEIMTLNGPQWFTWDVDRLVALGAVERTDASATVSQGLAFGPKPEVPAGREAPKGGVPVPENSNLPENVQTVPERNPDLSPEAQAALDEAQRIADAGKTNS